MIKEFQSHTSLIDFLQQIMPDFKGHFLMMRRPKSNNKAANALFSVWKDENNKVKEKVIKRPITCSMDDVNLMEREGLVKQKDGEKLEITQKGAEVIKTMILGDDRSIYEEKDKGMIDFETAYANTKPKSTKTAKTASIESGNWYRRLK
jgi:predicted transcriptional regulator